MKMYKVMAAPILQYGSETSHQHKQIIDKIQIEK